MSKVGNQMILLNKLKQEDVATKTKKSLESINSRSQRVMKSGKFILEYKQTPKMIRHGKRYCPALRKSEVLCHNGQNWRPPPEGQ
ncbi:60S ribosomal protein L30 isoform 1 [Camelus ferus]|nr:60S ribosomal protein L30 isoform 1 [Camelus ferus]